MDPKKNQPAQPSAVPQVKKKANKLLTIGLPAALGVLILVVVLVLVLVSSGKTSNDALSKFSSATSKVNSSSSDLTTAVSKSRYSADDNKSEIESDGKKFNEAIAEFEEATQGLKKDRKDLKEKAQNYSNALKEYKKSTVDLAIEYAPVSAISNKVDDVEFDSSKATDPAAFSTEISRIKGEYSKYISELKALSLNNDQVKSLRDAGVQLLEKMSDYFTQMDQAVQAQDTSRLTAISRELTDLSRNSDIEDKEEAITDKFSLTSDEYKKLSDVEKSLNDEIRKVNSKR